MARKQLVYGINDKPPLPILILAGAQHVLTLFGATTLVPLVLGPAMGMTTAQMGAFIGCVYFGMGIATLIQTHPKLGSGLPIVQGSSFSFIPPIMTIIGAYKSMGPDVVMQYVGGSLIVGGVALSALGYGRLIGRIRRIITPVVIGPTIMAIGFSLAPTAIQFNAANFWPVSLLVVVLVFFFSLVSKNKYFNIFRPRLHRHRLPALPRAVGDGRFRAGTRGLHQPPEHHRRAVAAPEPLHAVGRAEVLRPRHRRYSGGIFLRND